MAVLNPYEEKRRIESEEAYNKMKAQISNPENNSEFFMAQFKLKKMEQEIERLNKELQKYRNFFSGMSELMMSNGPFNNIF